MWGEQIWARAWGGSSAAGGSASWPSLTPWSSIVFFCGPVQLAGLVLPQVGELELGVQEASLGAGSWAPAWGLGSRVGGSGRTRGFWDQSGLAENLDRLGRPRRGRGLDFERQLFDHQRPREPENIWSVIVVEYFTKSIPGNLNVLNWVYKWTEIVH